LEFTIYVGIHIQTIKFHERWKSIFELKLKVIYIYLIKHSISNVHMNMSLYTSMFSIKIHVYYLMCQNEVFDTKILISN